MDLLEFNNDILFFKELDNKLSLGYKLISGNDFVLLLEKDNHKIKLILNNYSALIQDLMYPDYNNTILNTIGAIRNNFGYDSIYKSNTNIFDKYYNKVIILLLDGLGVNVLNKQLDDNSFIKKCYKYSQCAIYPSTTAASTTSFKSGLPPISTGWTGWENYIKEMNRNIVLFTGQNYFNDEPTGINGFKLMPYKMFYSDMDIEGFVVEPNFSKKEKLSGVLKRSLKINKTNKAQIQYVYYTEPDSIMHEYGYDSLEAKEILAKMDKEIEKYANRLSDDTLLIITADHGHTNVSQINLYACEPILKLLKRSPSNDSRCITFSVKEKMHKDFEFLFNSLFGHIYKLYDVNTAIKEGFFGLTNDFVHPRINDFLGDYVAIATSNYYFNYKSADSFIFKSHHAGITKNEMEVPICVYRK